MNIHPQSHAMSIFSKSHRINESTGKPMMVPNKTPFILSDMNVFRVVLLKPNSASILKVS